MLEVSFRFRGRGGVGIDPLSFLGFFYIYGPGQLITTGYTLQENFFVEYLNP